MAHTITERAPQLTDSGRDVCQSYAPCKLVLRDVHFGAIFAVDHDALREGGSGRFRTGRTPKIELAGVWIVLCS